MKRIIALFIITAILLPTVLVSCDKNEDWTYANTPLELFSNDTTEDTENIESAPKKNIVNFGDSIFGNYKGETSISGVIEKNIDANVYNCGFGGCQMRKRSNVQWDKFSMYKLADAICSGDWSEQEAVATGGVSGMPDYFIETVNMLKAIDFSTVDIITIAYGLNDFTIEEKKKPDNPDDKYDVTTTAGALRYSVEKIMDRYPHIRIVIIPPIFRVWFSETNTNPINMELSKPADIFAVALYDAEKNYLDTLSCSDGEAAASLVNSEAKYFRVYTNADYSGSASISRYNNPNDFDNEFDALGYITAEGIEPDKNYKCTSKYYPLIEEFETSDEHIIDGYKLTDFIAAIEGVANEYHLPTVDAYDELGINRFNCSTVYQNGDGAHPVEYGREIYGLLISEKLQYMLTE